MKVLTYILIAVIHFTAIQLNGQHTSSQFAEIDSLKQLITKTTSDSTKLHLRNAIGIKLVVKREGYWDSLRIDAQESHFPKFEASALIELGLIKKEQGNISLAIEYYHKSLKIQEKIGDKEGMARTLNNLGVIYHNLNINSIALDYYKKGIEIGIEIGTADLGDKFWNLSTIYPENSDSSLYYLKLSSNEYLKLGGDYGLGSYHYTLGIHQIRNNQTDSSIINFKKAIHYYKLTGHYIYVARSYGHITANEINSKNYGLAKVYADSCLNLSKKINNAEGIMEASKFLYTIYEEENDFKNAFFMLKSFYALKDSLSSQEIVNTSTRQNMQYEYEKEEAIKEAEHNKELEVIAEREKQQQIILYSSLIVLVIVVFFAIFIMKRLKITRQQKYIIETQKKEVTDSIQYAKRIQSAILPSNNVIKKYLLESFILYKPKDIVAGDFYWLEHKDGKVLFAAADCTGHGVPGAMVSVVCNNALNRSVREYGLTDPGQILNKTREIVIQEFEKSEEEVKDGMDIALCSIEGNILYYAGAHNPLWIIRNGELIETKANKQPIGQFDNAAPYTTHNFELQKGDSIYIFSDGYVDQFGGEKGKKFKAKALRELLLSIQNKTMEEQKEIINEAFETWKGNLEQIDDVCVIGVRIT